MTDLTEVQRYKVLKVPNLISFMIVELYCDLYGLCAKVEFICNAK